MNPSTALATVLVDELVRCGVREVVLCPGSRSAPLAYAVQQAERQGRLRLHVRVDERSAGFLALGLAKLSRRPAVVVTTSGTAVANLHPAVLEAHHGQVPLVVLTADRPVELRGTGANQTTHQPGLFGAAVRWQADLPAAEVRDGQVAAWRTTADRAVAAAVGSLSGWAGPVHLDVGFRDPLPPDLEPGPWPEPLEGRRGGEPWTAVPGPRAVEADGQGLTGPERTLVVLGDLPDPAMSAVGLRCAAERGWPVVAEPFGSAGGGPVLPHGSLLLTATDWLTTHLPERVLVIGRLTLSRDVAALLRRPGVRVEVVAPGPDWPDPGHVVREVHPWSALCAPSPDETPATSWARVWSDAGDRLAAAAGPVVTASWPSGVAAARVLAQQLTDEDVLVLGSSNPARDLELAGERTAATVVGNRGLAGIDGLVSTAVGVALARGSGAGRTFALLGDLTLLHDANGLLIGPAEPRPDLTLVVVNDDGGGIFSTLEYGEPARAADAERLFATPTGTDLAALCQAHGIGHELVRDQAGLATALQRRTDGIRVVEVPVPRQAARAIRIRLRELVAELTDGGAR